MKRIHFSGYLYQATKFGVIGILQIIGRPLCNLFHRFGFSNRAFRVAFATLEAEESYSTTSMEEGSRIQFPVSRIHNRNYNECKAAHETKHTEDENGRDGNEN